MLLEQRDRFPWPEGKKPAVKGEGIEVMLRNDAMENVEIGADVLHEL